MLTTDSAASIETTVVPFLARISLTVAMATGLLIGETAFTKIGARVAGAELASRVLRG